jgi:hypothetical protein
MGTITMATEALISMKMHVLVSGAEEWGNEDLLDPGRGRNDCRPGGHG